MNDDQQKAILFCTNLFNIYMENKSVFGSFTELEHFLHQYYLLMYKRDIEIARKIAREYVKLHNSNFAFYDAFMAKESIIKKDFSHLTPNIFYENKFTNPPTNIPSIVREKLTLVTGYFNLNKRQYHKDHHKDPSYYLNHARKLLQLPINFVIFTDPEFKEVFQNMRQGVEAKTLIIDYPLEQHEYYKYYEQLVKFSQKNPVRNNTYPPYHIVIQWSKFTMLKKIINLNPFKTSHFGWIDAAICHCGQNDEIDIVPEYIEEAFIDIPDKLKILLLRHFSSQDVNREDYYTYRRGFVAGGYFTGNKDNVGWLCDEFDKEVNHLIVAEKTPTEEQIIPRIIDKDRSRWTFWHGDYAEILTNHLIHRRGMRTTNFSIDYCRQISDHKFGIEICERVIKSYNDKQLQVFPQEMEKFLSEYYIIAYYAKGKEEAKRVALIYKELINTCTVFKCAFESHHDHIRNNFKFADVQI